MDDIIEIQSEVTSESSKKIIVKKYHYIVKVNSPNMEA